MLKLVIFMKNYNLQTMNRACLTKNTNLHEQNQHAGSIRPIKNNYKRMKKGLIFLMLIAMLPLMRLTAQNSNFEKLNTYRIGFFTKKLNLTSQEAEKFWPVYNEYQRQKNIIQLDKISIIREFNLSESTMSDNQLSEMGDKLIADVTQELSLAVTMHKKLKEILPPAKVIRFYQAENQYKAQLLEELQGIRQQQGEKQQFKQNQRRNF
jgi:hypothetical protein